MVCRAARCDKNLLRRRARFCDRDEQCAPAFEVLILGKQVQGEKEPHAPVAPISGLFPKRIEPSIQRPWNKKAIRFIDKQRVRKTGYDRAEIMFDMAALFFP